MGLWLARPLHRQAVFRFRPSRTKQRAETRTCAQLAEAFAESDLPWKVDLVQWRDLSPEFQQRIKEHRVVVHKPCHTQAYCRGGL